MRPLSKNTLTRAAIVNLAKMRVGRYFALRAKRGYALIVLLIRSKTFSIEEICLHLRIHGHVKTKLSLSLKKVKIVSRLRYARVRAKVWKVAAEQ